MTDATLVEARVPPARPEVYPAGMEQNSTEATTQQVFLVRHGETDWSRNGRHTGTTDLPLTEHGREAAKRLEPVLAGERFALVLTSPLRRARATCSLAGLSERCETDPDLHEWDYGDFEGLTTAEIEARAPGWNLFTDGCPHGERPEQVGARVDRVIDRVRSVHGDVALFAHGHVSRVFVARWIGLAPSAGQHFLLDTATVNILTFSRGIPVIKRWNAPLDPRTGDRLEDA